MTTHPANVVSMVYNKIGDVLLSLPTLRALAARLGPLRLVIGGDTPEFLFRGIPQSGPPLRLFHGGGERYGELAIAPVLAALGPVDTFVSITLYPRDGAPALRELARACGARRTVGLALALDEALPCDPRLHVFDLFYTVARHVAPEIRFEDVSGPPVLSPAAIRAARRQMAAIRPAGGRVLFLHPETLEEKCWPTASFDWVVRELLHRRPDLRVLVTTQAAWSLGPSVDPARVSYLDVHLELAMALVAESDLFLGIDSCFLHAADLFRRPGVAIFGYTYAERWGFLLSPSRNIVGASRATESAKKEAVLEALLELSSPGQPERGEQSGEDQARGERRRDPEPLGARAL